MYEFTQISSIIVVRCVQIYYMPAIVKILVIFYIRCWFSSLRKNSLIGTKMTTKNDKTTKRDNHNKSHVEMRKVICYHNKVISYLMRLLKVANPMKEALYEY